MPATSNNTKKSIIPIIAVGIIIIVVVMFALRFFLFTSGEESNTTLQSVFSKVNFSSMETRSAETKKFNFGIINDDKFYELSEINFKVNDFNEINVGKKNLFLEND